MADMKMMSEEDRLGKLEAFAQALCRKRKEAVEGRAGSGCEQEWSEDEEFYDGIDDNNRAEVMLKGATMDGTPYVEPEKKGGTKSTVFVNVTQPYCDMAAARVSDMLLPNDDKPFAIEPTPMPDIVAAAKDPSMLMMPDGSQQQAAVLAQQMIDKAKASADKAETQVWDWLVESQWHGEVRQVIEDAAKVGTGVLKGPYPVKQKVKAMQRNPDGGITLVIQEKTVPGCKRINYRDFFPDAACGQNIHNGNYVWERDRITARQLRELKGTMFEGAPLYIDSQIDQVLEEGPQRKYTENRKEEPSEKDMFEMWHYHGVATSEDLMASGCDCPEGKTIPVIITMVNDRVIKAALSTLDSGEFPYDVMVWQRRSDKWTGKGVARQIRTPQRIVNAATRNMMDNAGVSAGPQIVIDQDSIYPSDGIWDIRPLKLWLKHKNAELQDVKMAITSVLIPSLQQELAAIIQYGMDLAERVTSMPLLMQGQQGSATDKVGGMMMLQNNASSVLRRIAKIFDDDITIPKINRYYEWLLLYGEDEEAKGDFVIQAKGSSALYERDAANQAILQMAQIISDPEFRVNKAKWFAEMSKAQKIDPTRIQYSDDEWKQLQQQKAQQGLPQDPRIAAAQINADAKIKTEQIAAGADMQKAQMDRDRDTLFEQAQTQRDQIQSNDRHAELELKLHLAMLDYANRNQINLDQLKTQLSDTAMKLQTQKQLSAMDAEIELHKHHNPPPQALTPPTEPAGRAEPGHAFQQ